MCAKVGSPSCAVVRTMAAFSTMQKGLLYTEYSSVYNMGYSGVYNMGYSGVYNMGYSGVYNMGYSGAYGGYVVHDIALLCCITALFTQYM